MGNIRGESAKKNREKNKEKKNKKKLALGDIRKIKNLPEPLSKKLPNLKKWNESFRTDDFKGSSSRFDTKKKDSNKKDSNKKDSKKKDNNKRKLALGDLPKKSKAQLMAIKRKKDDLKISDVVAANKKSMRERARERNKKYWEKRNKK